LPESKNYQNLPQENAVLGRFIADYVRGNYSIVEGSYAKLLQALLSNLRTVQTNFIRELMSYAGEALAKPV